MFSPDDRYFAYRAEKEGDLDWVNVYELQDGISKFLVEIECKSEGGYIDKLGFHEDSQRLFTFSTLGELNIWRMDDGEEFNKFELGESPNRMALSRDSSTFFTAGNEGIIIWDFFQQEKIGELSLPDEKYKGSFIPAFAYSDNGIAAAIFSAPSIFPSLSNNGSELSAILQIWDTKKEEEDILLTCDLPEDSLHIGLHENGELLAADWKGSNIRLWHIPTKKWMNLDGPRGKKLLGVRFDPQSQKLAAAWDNGQIFIWDIPAIPQTGRWKKVRKRRKIQIAHKQILDLFFDGNILIVLTPEQLIHMDLALGAKEEFPYKVRQSSGMHLCKNKRFLIFSTCFDNTAEIIFYDLKAQRILTRIELEGTKNRALNFCIDSEEKYLLTSDVEQPYTTIFNLEFLIEYLTYARESDLFQRIYKNSFHHLPYEFENIELHEIEIEGDENRQIAEKNVLPVEMSPWAYLNRSLEE